jgi:ankyrin repeat protein
LHAASRRGPLDVVKLLLERGADPNARNDEGQTPLHIASQEGVSDVVQCLLTAGADANIRDRDGKIARDVASNNKKSEVVQLLTKPARPNVRENRRQMSSQLQAVGLPRQTIGSPRRQSVTTRERRAGQ